jgi:isopenicillin N synthase-like dioxygenase
MSSSKVSSLNLNDYLSADPTVKQKFVDDLYNSFRNTGFVVLKNHTITS